MLFDQGYKFKEKPIVIWDIEKAEVTKSFDQTFLENDSYNLANLVTISPDEKLICGYYGISKGLLCWEKDGDGSVKFAFHDDRETGDHYFCGFSSDGKRFAVLKSRQNRIEFINSQTGKVESALEQEDDLGCNNLETHSSWSPDDKFLIANNGDDILSFWRIADGTRTGSFKLVEKRNLIDGVYDRDVVLSFNPTKPILMSVSNKFIRLWELETGKMLEKLERVGVTQWSPDGTLLQTGSEDKNRILLWEILYK